MKKRIEVIKPGHDWHKESIDGLLGQYGWNRFKVNLTKTALKQFIRLSKRISNEKLPDGALLMLGYVSDIEEKHRYFSKGVNPDIAEKRLRINNQYGLTLEKIIKRAKSGDKHDGAVLLTPEGILQHTGYGLEPHTPTILEAYGYRDYYHQKRELNIKKGGTRLKSALSHSLLFLNAVVASISKDSDKRKYFVMNGRVFPILKESIKWHYNNPPAQSYRPPQRP